MADRMIRGWRGRATVLVGIAMAACVIASAGCGHPLESGYADQGRTQVQFFAPPGSTVTVRGCPTRSHQIAVYGSSDNRLERSPEEYSVFNLAPGTYEFKYVTAEGLPGVSVYGELEIYYANTAMAQVFQRRAFVPISLPSEYYRQVEITGNEIFPYRGEAFRRAIDERDIQRLRQGDVIEKVFVVADLERAARKRDQIIEDLHVLDRKIEYVNARFRKAYQSYRLDIDDPMANLFRTDRQFIYWEQERQEAEQKRVRLEEKLQRTEALLKADNSLSPRQGMLVLTTLEVVGPYRDPVDASDRIGEVLAVMRIGGRHMHWGDPRQELVSYNPGNP